VDPEDANNKVRNKLRLDKKQKTKKITKQTLQVECRKNTNLQKNKKYPARIQQKI
jgi:hypothetical protein